jgi:hypothetical protein
LATVRTQEAQRAEDLLASLEHFWSDMPDTASALQHGDPVDAEDFIMDECATKENRLNELAEFARTGKLTTEQYGRFVHVKALIETNKPLLDKAIANLR